MCSISTGLPRYVALSLPSPPSLPFPCALTVPAFTVHNLDELHQHSSLRCLWLSSDPAALTAALCLY